MVRQPRQWIIKTPEPLSGDALISALLSARGVRKELEDQFFSPNFDRDLHDPFLFRDMKKAVERILQALSKKEKVLIYGDYDVDGVTSSTMLFELLSHLGIETDVYLPHRENEGYGMKKEVLSAYAKKRFRLVISVDCGISNVEEVDFANASGMDVMIFDHHIPPSIVPNALAIINPKLQTDSYPFADLSAGGVVFKVIQGFLKHPPGKKITEAHGMHEGWEKWLLDLVAVSTICDSMPLVGENRVLVKYGLIVLSKTRRMGLKRLMEAARLSSSSVDTEGVGFYIGPRLNAAGRMEHADLAFQLLNATDDGEAVRLSQVLQQANTSRQKLVERIMQEAREQLSHQKDQYALVAYGADWPAGIVGLVAGKLKDEYYRPTFVIGRAGKSLTGSGRSIEELNIVEVLEKIRNDGVLKKFGGHQMACGFSLVDQSSVELFRTKVNTVVEESIRHRNLTPRLLIEAHLPLEAISDALVGQISQFAPYGNGNEEPKFLASSIEVMGVETVGLTKKHIRTFLRDAHGHVWKAMGFGWNTNGHLPFEAGSRLDIVYELSENEWNGNREIQIELVDVRAAENKK